LVQIDSSLLELHANIYTNIHTHNLNFTFKIFTFTGRICDLHNNRIRHKTGDCIYSLVIFTSLNAV
jgi:hypothetical protein